VRPPASTSDRSAISRDIVVMGVAIFDGESAVVNLRFLMELGSARTEVHGKSLDS